jgi:hypothetical protein
LNLARSSSIIRAGRLTRSLFGGSKDQSRVESPGGAHKIYAQLPTFDESLERSASGAVPTDEYSLLQPPVDLDSWELLLEWGMEVCHARAAFVVDSQGFVIASRGNVPTDGFAGIGAETCYLMGEIEGIDGEAGPLKSIEMTFQNRTILGFRMILTDGAPTAVGFIISQRPSSTAMDVLIDHITNWLAKRL